MANNPITTPLPADLPTDWTYGQTIAANGSEVGLSQQHGYNYLMQQVNAAQQAAKQIGQAFSGLPSSSDLQNVQNNLNNHINNKENPHEVSASQVSTSEGGNVENSLSQKIDKITALSPPTDLNSVLESGNYRLGGDSPGFTNGPSSGAGWGLMSVVGYSNDTVAQILYQLGNNVWFRMLQDGRTWYEWSKIPSLESNGFLPVSSGGTGVGSLADLATQLAANGGCQFTHGSFVGPGVSNQISTLTVTFPFKPTWFCIVGSKINDTGRLGSPPTNAGYSPQSQVYIPALPTSQPSKNWESAAFSRSCTLWFDLNTNTFHCITSSPSDGPFDASETFYWVAF